MEGATTIFAILPLIISTVFLTGATAESSGTGPIMTSTHSHLTVIQGDTVVLPCRVLNLGRNVRVWKQLPSNILFSGTIAVSRDSSVSLVNDSLQIEKITPAYAGDYVCQVSKHPQVNVVHKIQVHVPPTVTPDPPEGKIVLRRGESASIFCNSSGIPKPRVLWVFGDEQMLRQGVGFPPHIWEAYDGSHIRFDSVDINHAGMYRCRADNGVGEPAVATFTVTVHYAPVLWIEPEWAHGDVGATVEFVCSCGSLPLCQVAWLQGDHKSGQKLENGERIQLKLRQIEQNLHEYSLRIRQLRKEDLGPYTCTAKNALGSTWQTVMISGLAEPARLKGKESGEGSFLLRWRVKSYSPIIEYQLKIRRHKSGDQWVDVVIPASIQEGQSFLYSQSYNVTGLEPGTRYEAVLQAHNTWGWNRPSDTFLFGEEFPPTEPEIEDTETAPSLLPLYDAELDVTDPTYLKQNTATMTPVSILSLLIYLSTIFFIQLHISYT